MHLKKLQKNKKIIGIVSIAIIIGVTGFVFASQRFDGMLGASIVNWNVGGNNESHEILNKNNKSDVFIETAAIVYNPSDSNTEENPAWLNLILSGVIEKDKKSEPINVWFEYNTNKNFSLFTQKAINIKPQTPYIYELPGQEFGQIGGKSFVIQKMININTFKEDSRYFGRFVVQTKNGFTRYNIGEFKTPTSCTVNLQPLYQIEDDHFLRTGQIDLTRYRITNNCNKEVSYEQVKIVTGGSLAIDKKNSLSNLKIRINNEFYPMTGKSGEIAIFQLDNIKIPAKGTMYLNVIGELSGKFNKNDTLSATLVTSPVSLIELEGTMNPLFRLPDNSYPRITGDQQSYYYNYSKVK